MFEMNNEIKKIVFRRFCKQRERCNSVNSTQYPWYGAKGVKVEYSFQELWNWFQKEFKDCKHNIKDMNIGRIDHSKNYSLDNVVLQTKADNIKEMSLRCTTNKKPVLILDYKTMEPLVIADSVEHAAHLCGISRAGNVTR